jgi:predicted SAM-dependent methyltransferase
MERRLHIGGKQVRAGWEILNINPGPGVDHVGDAVALSGFADGTFTEIYGSHVLEHFDYKDGLILALREWRRVLAPGGTLRLSVPDLDMLARLMLDRQRLDINQRYHVMRMIFGGHIDAHDYHLVGLNEEFLAGFLHGAGFVQLQRVSRHGIFQDTSDLVFGGVCISLNMTARCPVTADGAGASSLKPTAESAVSA